MKRPLLMVALFYGGGILLADFLPWKLPVLPTIAGSLWLGLVTTFWGRARPYLVWALLAASGVANLSFRQAVLSPNDLRTVLGEGPEIVVVRGRLSETPYLRVYQNGEEQTLRMLAQIDLESIRRRNGPSRPVFGRITASTQGVLSNSFFGGRVVELEGVLARPRTPVAEGVFDYRSYLARHGIYYQLQVDSTNDWRLADFASAPAVPLADRFASWARGILAHGLPEEDEPLHLLWAMTLGWRTALSGEVAEPFMRSGTILELTSHTTDRNLMKPVVYTAYSYVRLSSKRQLSKNSTGQERQESKPEAICKQHGWNLSPKSFKDLGVSAFKGKNRLQGDLAAFIQLAKDQKLGPNPLLIIEAFDRFSRQDIDESESAFKDLLKSGVAVHVSFSNKTFTPESTKSLVDRIEILVSLKAAYEYSANLSSRVKSAKEKKRDKILNGEVVTHNNVPKYFTFDKESQTYGHNTNTKVVQRIVEEFLAGNSLYSIATKLNQTKTPPFRYGSQWSACTVRSVLRNKALIGEFMGNPKFLPKIIEKEDFARVQVQLNRNKGFAGQTGELMNIFRGVCVCSSCGKAMSVLSNSKDYRTKKKWKTPYRYLRCSTVGTGKQQCTHRKVISIQPIEDEFFGVFLLQDPRQMMGNSDNAEQKRLKDKLTEHQSRIDKITKAIAKTTELIDDETDIAEVREKLKKLEAERKQEKAAMDGVNLQISAVNVSAEEFKDLKKLFKNISTNTRAYDDAIREIQEILKDNEVRKQIRVLLPSLLEKIVVDTEKGTWVVYNRSGAKLYTGPFDHPSIYIKSQAA